MLSSDFPALGSKPAPRNSKQPASLERKQGEKTGRKKHKFASVKQESHPALPYKDNSSDLLDLGRDLLKDVLRHVGEFSQAEMVQLSLSSRDLHGIVKNNPCYWRTAIVTDFDWTARLSDFNVFKLYNFLCQYKWLEGKFIIDHQGTRFKNRRCRSPTHIEMLEIEITDTGLVMSIWRSPGLAREARPLQKKVPFLEVKFEDFDNNEHLDLDYHKNVSTLREMDERIDNEWHNKGGTVEGFLSRKGSLTHKLINMLDQRHLIPLHVATANGLDFKYLKWNGSWPQALPRPGVYANCHGQKGYVSYTSDTFRLILPAGGLNHKRKDINVQVASAFVMPLECQMGLKFSAYMDYENGLQGNPNLLDDLHVFIMPISLGTFPAAMARAWYSPCPPNTRREGRWKVAVVNEDEFYLITDRRELMNPWHLRRRRDIT